MVAAWQEYRLGEFFRIKHGYAFKGKYFSNSGPYILLTPGNFKAEGGIKLKGEKEKYYVGDFPKEFIHQKGELVVVMTDLKQSAPILGSSAFIPEDNRFLHNQRLGKIVELENNIDEYYLYCLFNYKSVREQIKATATGATVKHTAPERIYAVKVKVPRITTQRKIASILRAYDDLIENNTRRIKILEEMAQAIYREWFVNFRYPGHEKVKMVESELGMIPEGWEVKRVENLVKRIKPGKLYAQKTAKLIGKIPILDQGRSGIIGYHDNEPGVVASPDNPIIVFANHTCYQRLILHPFSAIQNVLPFLPADENYRSIYWLHWSTKDVIEFNDYKGHWPEFMNKRIFLPPSTICDEFGTVVQPIVRMIYNFEQKNQNLRQTRDLLLPKLISGELDVSELDIETGG